jgi:hypothetical protein
LGGGTIALLGVQQQAVLEVREASTVKRLGVYGIIDYIEAVQTDDIGRSWCSDEQVRAGVPSLGIGPQLDKVVVCLLLDGLARGGIRKNLDGILEL